MTTIYFANGGVLDLDTIRTMGVSVKPETSSPIGYFGTGLKYAIATLLRTHHEVTLTTGGETYEFKALPCQIRGETFMVVHMNHEKLAFTTDLGKNWEPWMAFRELYSNCLDENGKVSDKPFEADTVWAVRGFGITEAYYSKHEVFLHTDPLWTTGIIEIHPGSSDYVFYRGVRVAKLIKPTKFTYNFTKGVTLTEDRTAKSIFDMLYRLGSLLPRVPDEKFAQKMLRKRNTEHMEDSSIDFSYCSEPSDEFLEVVSKKRADATLNKSLHELVDRYRKPDFKVCRLSRTQLDTIEEAFRMLKILNCHLTMDEVHFVEHLGPGVYGCVQAGQIYIAEQTIDNGADFLCITLWEEYIHRDLGHKDCSRSMQQYLFDKILAFVKEKT